MDQPPYNDVQVEAFSVCTILGRSQFGDVWLWFLHVAPTPVKGLLVHMIANMRAFFCTHWFL